MNMPQMIRRHWLGLSSLAVAAACAAGAYWLTRGTAHAGAAKPESHSAEAAGTTEPAESGRAAVRVEAVHPSVGGVVREIVRPASVIAYESADLYAKISGYLKEQKVDVGSRVKQGDTLVQIDAPEFVKAAEQAGAAVDQAIAERSQAAAKIETAKAERNAALAFVKQAEAEIKRAKAVYDFRVKQHDRIQKLVEQKAVDARLLDEKLDEMEASMAAEMAARAGVATAEAKVSAADANVAQAEADLVSAKANVEVAKAARDKAKVFVDFAAIVSPYDGVVTKRNFFRGAFIRAAEQGGVVPLLAVSRTDLMRVWARVPDRDVPYVSVGNAVKVDIDALPGEEFQGQVSRIADAEDPETRTMYLEVDLPNPQDKLREGMYGSMTIHLNQGEKRLTVPSSCLVGDINNSQGSVYVIEEGIARPRAVSVGTDNGVRTEIVKGLGERDAVISRHSGPLADGTRVEVVSGAGGN
ncbi:MAG TPA: efflux RND transporter periplasmic adaptor subunit [Pirellulales bacterium]|nr:efflux RND transporter periplasmic adaptor subunit [Pirellulales bacterium]